MTAKPKYDILKLSDLKLDPYNPRLPKSLHGQNETKIIEYMLLDASLIELMLAIGENNFFPGEQLLTVKDTDDKYKVIEGNRRLSAVKLLSNPELATVQKTKIEKVLEETKHRPQDIPCLIFNSESEIHNYLGYRHITGIKEWKLLEKARYLNGLRIENYAHIPIDQASREIAKIIGSRMDYVRRILIGYEIYSIIEDEAFFKIRDLNDTTFHFNYIADSLNKANITEFLGVDFTSEKPTEHLNEAKLKKWSKWLFEKNEQNRTRLIGTSTDLSKLNKILGNESARNAWDDKGLDLDRAYELTEDVSQIFSESIKKSIEYLEQADNIVHRINEFYVELDEDLTSIRKLTAKIKNTKDTAEDEKF
jgi:hypothetical protein